MESIGAKEFVDDSVVYQNVQVAQRDEPPSLVLRFQDDALRVRTLELRLKQAGFPIVDRQTALPRFPTNVILLYPPLKYREPMTRWQATFYYARVVIAALWWLVCLTLFAAFLWNVSQTLLSLLALAVIVIAFLYVSSWAFETLKDFFDSFH